VKQGRLDSTSSRREFFSDVSATLIASGSSYIGLVLPANAASPEVFATPNGIKYATIKPATGKGSPLDKDIVAIEYTGYLTDGTIFGTSRLFSSRNDEFIFPLLTVNATFMNRFDPC
jgi:FKBP-type peptidyl-prolyl cis-trans isomerase